MPGIDKNVAKSFDLGIFEQHVKQHSRAISSRYATISQDEMKKSMSDTGTLEISEYDISVPK